LFNKTAVARLQPSDDYLQASGLHYKTLTFIHLKR
jgi:hypothetical protein